MRPRFALLLLLIMQVAVSFAQDTIQIYFPSAHSVDSIGNLMLKANGNIRQRIILEHSQYRNPQDSSQVLDGITETKLTYAGKILSRKRKLIYQVIVLQVIWDKNRTRNWTPQLKEMLSAREIFLVNKEFQLCARVKENRFRFRDVILNRYLTFESAANPAECYQLDAGIDLRNAKNHIVTKEKPGETIAFIVYMKPGTCTLSNWNCDTYDSSK
jgi:hypothetical protein